jgi:hypothetical protein
MSCAEKLASTGFWNPFIFLAPSASLWLCENHIVLTQRPFIWRLTLAARYNPSLAQSERNEDFTTIDTIDKNTAYELSHAFPVTQATLFDAFINSAILKDIWGVSSITVDARPGGQARARLTIDQENWDFTITYQELVPASKLRWVVHFDRFPSKETSVKLLFKPTVSGSEATVRMENFENPQERDANKQAWEAALSMLEGIVGK